MNADKLTPGSKFRLTRYSEVTEVVAIKHDGVNAYRLTAQAANGTRYPLVIAEWADLYPA